MKTKKVRERLDEALRIRKMKPVELSRKTGISEATISQYRAGSSEPKRDKIAILSEALDVSPAWLMGLDVPMQDIKPEDLDFSYTITDDEKIIIETYRKSDDEKKRLIHYLLGLQ